MERSAPEAERDDQTASRSEPLRVAIDATPLIGDQTGIGVFTSELITSLNKRDDVALSAFAVTVRGRNQLASAVPAGVPTEQRPMPARPLHWLWSHSNRGRAERFMAAPDVIHGTNFTVPPTRRAGQVVTVHDLTFIRYPEMCLRPTLRYAAQIQRALRRGAMIHTDSAFVANEVKEHFKVGRDAVVPVHLGVPRLPGPDWSAARALIGGDRPYILSVGTAEPRKDLPGLVRAFGLLASEEPELHLVLAGPDGWGSEALGEAIAASPVKHRIIQPGFVAAATLAALLVGARVLAYPSLYEGFGFPPLQAMAAGVPVVTTTVGSLPEIAGDAALLVTPGDVDELAGALAVASVDEARRSILVTAGRARAGDFSWENTATGLMSIYERSRQR